MVRKEISFWVSVKFDNRGIEYYSCRNDAKMSFHSRDKYKMIKIIQIILDKNRWRLGNHGLGNVTDTCRFASVAPHLRLAGLADVDYFGNTWYKQDLEEVLKDLKLSSISKDILKNKNIDKLKEILKDMSLDELIYLHESGVVNE